MSVRILQGDCRDVLATLDADSFDSCVTDPPYHLSSIVKRFGADNAAPAKLGETGAYARASAGFMGKQWDGGDVAMRPETWAEVYRVLKPGAHLLAFGGTRTFHRVAVAIEDAGFEIRDTVCWLYGSGFPKSHDVAKAIDALRMTGGSGPTNLRQRDMGEAYRPHDLAGMPGYGDGRMSRGADTDRDYSSPPPLTTPEALQWQGWGTALKPAWEPIIMARKPLAESSIARNVLAHGTGAINVDGCRVGVERREAAFTSFGPCHGNKLGAAGTQEARRGTQSEPKIYEGRWPANVAHDGSAEVETAFATFGESKSSGTAGTGQSAVYGEFDRTEIGGQIGKGDTGTPSRYFYSGKAGPDDRLSSRHPTVKPVALMRWLVRMVTPPGGMVLDPFAGSGTTGMACIRESFDATLIEREAEYVADIHARLDHIAGKDTPLFDFETS